MNLLLNNCSAVLNDTGRWFCNYGIDIFIQSGILIILLLIIDFLLRKRLRATFRYWIWMLVLLKLMLPPAFSLPTGIGRWFGDYVPAQTSISQQVSNTARLKPAGASAPQDPSFSGEFPQVHLSQASPEPAAPALPVISDSQALTWQAIVFVIWFTGTAVLSVLLVHCVLFVRRLIAQSEPAKNGHADRLKQLE
jgi:bla regulator protein BlaR1